MNDLKKYDKYIFDEDNTLLLPDWEKERNYFEKVLPKDELERYMKDALKVLDVYEKDYFCYDVNLLSDFLKRNGFSFTPEIVEGWIHYNGYEIEDVIPEGVQELFKYLYENGKEIVILTNWFSGTQVPRLKKAGLYKYVSKIVAGEDALKPHKEAFEKAIGNTPKSKCLMIGDGYKKDFLGAKNFGIDAVLIDKKFTIKDFLDRIKEE